MTQKSSLEARPRLTLRSGLYSQHLPRLAPVITGRENFRSQLPVLRGRWRDSFTWPQRVNDETENGDANAGIGDIEGRPRVSKRDMQIEEQKIDNMSVTETIGQIPKNAGK